MRPEKLSCLLIIFLIHTPLASAQGVGENNYKELNNRAIAEMRKGNLDEAEKLLCEAAAACIRKDQGYFKTVENNLAVVRASRRNLSDNSPSAGAEHADASGQIGSRAASSPEGNKAIAGSVPTYGLAPGDEGEEGQIKTWLRPIVPNLVANAHPELHVAGDGHCSVFKLSAEKRLVRYNCTTKEPSGKEHPCTVELIVSKDNRGRLKPLDSKIGFPDDPLIQNHKSMEPKEDYFANHNDNARINKEAYLRELENARISQQDNQELRRNKLFFSLNAYSKAGTYGLDYDVPNGDKLPGYNGKGNFYVQGPAAARQFEKITSNEVPYLPGVRLSVEEYLKAAEAFRISASDAARSDISLQRALENGSSALKQTDMVSKKVKDPNGYDWTKIAPVDTNIDALKIPLDANMDPELYRAYLSERQACRIDKEELSQLQEHRKLEHDDMVASLKNHGDLQNTPPGSPTSADLAPLAAAGATARAIGRK